MDNKNPENIHIYLKSDKDQEMLKNVSSYEKYIILTNETLHSENRDLRIENSKLSEQVEKLEDDCDKVEKSVTYMRGFLKNLVIMEQISCTKSEEYKKIHCEFINAIKKFNTVTFKHFRYLQCLMVLIVAIFYETQFYSLMQSILLIVIFIVFSAFHESTIKEMSIPNSIENHIKKIQEKDVELTELKKGQDFLNEYIDIM
jgi:hypothetical protein